MSFFCLDLSAKTIAKEQPNEKCIRVGVLKEDKLPVYTCPEGVLEQNAVGYKHRSGKFWYFNENRFASIIDAIGVIFDVAPQDHTQDPKPTKDPVPFPAEDTADNNKEESTAHIPITDQYDNEPYSEEVLNNKTVEYAAALWALDEMKNKNVCVFGNEKAKEHYEGWVSGINHGINARQMFQVELQGAMDALKNRPISSNPQIEALNFQINSLKVMNRAIMPIFKLNNLYYFFNSTQTYMKTARANAGNGFEKLAIKYNGVMAALDENLNKCNPAKHKCSEIKDKSDALAAKLQEYAKNYQLYDTPSSTVSVKVMTVQLEINSLLSHFDGPNKEQIQKMVTDLAMARLDDMILCPEIKGPDASKDSAISFAKSMGIEINQKNTEIFRNVWKLIDNNIAHSYSRQILFNRADRFINQIKKWSVILRKSNEEKIAKLQEARKKLRASLGLPEHETLEEAAARISSDIKNHPDFVKIIQKTGGSNVWYVAQMKKKDGTLYERDLMENDGKPTLCDGILQNGCPIDLN